MSTDSKNSNKIAIGSGILSIFSLLVAIWGAWGTHRQATTAIQSLNKELEQSRKLEEETTKLLEEQKILAWQEYVVYNIIDNIFTSNNFQGVTFKEVQDNYLKEAQKVTDISLPKSQLTDERLKKILYEMILTNKIFITTDRKYAVNVSYLPSRFDRKSIYEESKFAVLNILTQNEGLLTASEFYQKLNQKINLTNEEYDTLLVELIAANQIIMDKNSKMWSAINSHKIPDDLIRKQ